MIIAHNTPQLCLMFLLAAGGARVLEMRTPSALLQHVSDVDVDDDDDDDDDDDEGDGIGLYEAEGAVELLVQRFGEGPIVWLQLGVTTSNWTDIEQRGYRRPTKSKLAERACRYWSSRGKT